MFFLWMQYILLDHRAVITLWVILSNAESITAQVAKNKEAALVIHAISQTCSALITMSSVWSSTRNPLHAPTGDGYVGSDTDARGGGSVDGDGNANGDRHTNGDGNADDGDMDNGDNRTAVDDYVERMDEQTPEEIV